MEDSAAALILAIVRGEKPWTELATMGISVTFDGNTTHVNNPRRIEAVAHASDIAKGLVAHWANPKELQEWARIILTGVDFLDLELDEASIGDILIDAIWDAGFGGAVSDQAYRLATRYVVGEA